MAKKSDAIITFLLDKSGSMNSIRDDTIGAFNAYIDTLKSEGTPGTFSLLQFDSMAVEKTHHDLPIKDVPALTLETFVPRATTPLIDAAYKTIKAVEAVAEKRPAAKVIICIQTDGQENCSREHTWAELNALIKEKSALGWQFNFMGSSIDAYAQGSRMGISAVNTMSYDSGDRAATMASFSASAKNSADFANGMSANTAYTGKQRAAAKDKFASAALMNADAPAAVDDISL